MVHSVLELLLGQFDELSFNSIDLLHRRGREQLLINLEPQVLFERYSQIDELKESV
jgi:hypothetical protein